MSFEKESLRPVELAEQLEALADALAGLRPDAAHLHGLAVLDHLFAQCCGLDELRAVRTGQAPDVGRLRALVEDARAGKLATRELWGALRPVLDGLFI